MLFCCLLIQFFVVVGGGSSGGGSAGFKRVMAKLRWETWSNAMATSAWDNKNYIWRIGHAIDARDAESLGKTPHNASLLPTSNSEQWQFILVPFLSDFYCVWFGLAGFFMNAKKIGNKLHPLSSLGTKLRIILKSGEIAKKNIFFLNIVDMVPTFAEKPAWSLPGFWPNQWVVQGKRRFAVSPDAEDPKHPWPATWKKFHRTRFVRWHMKRHIFHQNFKKDKEHEIFVR